MRIGEVLKRARTRQRLDIRTVEERTKIRTRYLRALEAEEWDVLPSPAYAKGFLRTYAQLLGLDADALGDAFRQQVESRLDPGDVLGLSEPVLEGRRRPGERNRRGLGPGALAAAGVALAIGILLVVGLIGGDDEPGAPDRRAERRQDDRRGDRGDRDGERSQRGGDAKGSEEPGVLHLTVTSAVPVCLVSGSGEVLIAGQVLSPGTEERFTRDHFELRFPGGYERSQFGLTLDGRRVRLPRSAPAAAFEIEPGSPPRQLDPPGMRCP
jgi:Helix-turn-helix domain